MGNDRFSRLAHSASVLATALLSSGFLVACTDSPTDSPSVSGMRVPLTAQEFTVTVDSVTPSWQQGRSSWEGDDLRCEDYGCIIAYTVKYLGEGERCAPILVEDDLLSSEDVVYNQPCRQLDSGSIVQDKLFTTIDLDKNAHRFYFIGGDKDADALEIYGTVILGPDIAG